MEMIVINQSKLKIMLTPPDMRKYDLSSGTLDCTDESTRRTFRRIIEDARAETGFETAGEQLFIQLYTSRDGGCELFVTKLGHAPGPDEEQESPEHALLRKVFSVEVTSAAPKDDNLTSMPTAEVPVRSSPGTRPVALLLGSLDDALHVCTRLRSIGYNRDSQASLLDNGQWCLLLRVPDTSYIRLPKPFGFLTEYGTVGDASVLIPYASEHGSLVCPSRAVEILGALS